MAKKEQSRRTQKSLSLFFPFLFTKRLLGAWSQQYFTITKKGRQQMQINKAAELHRSKVGQNENRWQVFTPCSPRSPWPYLSQWLYHDRMWRSTYAVRVPDFRMPWPYHRGYTMIECDVQGLQSGTRGSDVFGELGTVKWSNILCFPFNLQWFAMKSCYIIHWMNGS